MIILNVTDKQAQLSLNLADAGETALSSETILNSLSEKGVCCGILEDAINDVVAQVNSRGDGHQAGELVIENIIVACQIEPTLGTPAAIEFLFRNGEIVAPGDEDLRGVIVEDGTPPW